ncbi:hypothetical protein QYM36_007277 [Artemia franciscana]|uniref:HAT C-terminal dimerisation domain-containing protein n=1 Tax=Artemia franciscana TaxID=6661 RepID=A0AA88I2N4_ARTSF|nr:hypothetical protein QYM36_007277 [Artemia franciscana]
MNDDKSERKIMKNNNFILRRETCDEEFALVFEQVKELSDKIQLAVEVPRIKQRQVHRNNPPHTTPEEYYRRVVFIPMLDSVISDLKSRFSRDTLNSFRSTVLQRSNIVNCTDDLLQSSVKEISRRYGQLLGLTVPSTRATLILAEVHLWTRRWLRVKREGGIIPSSVEETAKECDRHLYPYVSSLLDIFISLPATVASAERSFSSLRKLKTWFRGQMGQTRLSGLALLNVHHDIDISIDRPNPSQSGRNRIPLKKCVSGSLVYDETNAMESRVIVYSRVNKSGTVGTFRAL